MQKHKPQSSLESLEFAGRPLPLSDAARVIDQLNQAEHTALASLVARFSNGRTIRPYRTGFEVEHA